MKNRLGKGKQIVYLDLFSGAGGFALGLKQAGFRFSEHYFSEIDAHAVANYQYNFPHARQLGDIRNIGKTAITAPDIISFGSPCQDISIAGGRKGLKGKRSSLFFEAVRLIKAYRPRVFLFENVKGLFSSNGGKDFEIVLETLADIGLYEIQWQLLDTAWFLPQHRQRIYLVGHLRGSSCPQIFPVPTGDQLPEKIGSKGQGGKDIASTITSTYSKGVHGRGETYIRSKAGIRRLTPVECERLQGFPDNWTQYGSYEGQTKEISDTQRYKLLGNAVSVAVVKVVARKLRSNPDKELSGIMKSKTATPVEIRLPVTREDFVAIMQQDLTAQKHHTKLTVEKLAAALAITDKTEVKELTELAIVRCARELAQGKGTLRDRYDKIVTLYKSQVNLSHRTSMSMLLQQYSTPAPIGFLMGIFAGLDKLHQVGGYGFEPSAGNGLLTIAGRPERIYVNEVDEVRNRNLKTQGFANVWNRDASEAFSYSDIGNTFSAVVTNPPFGTLRKSVFFDTYKINTLDGLMALKALESMSRDGRAAVIMGGHTRWGKHGRIQGGRNRIFFNYLYNRYHVLDVININGRNLFSRQGTSFNTRIILINGRKAVAGGVAPLYNPQHDKIANTFDDLYDRFTTAMEQLTPQTKEPYMSTLAKRYEQKYLPLKERYEGRLILLRNDMHYEVYGSDKGTEIFDVAQITQSNVSAHFDYKGDGILLLRLPAEGRQWIDDVLRKSGKPYAMIDELEKPEAPTQQKSMIMKTRAEKYKQYRKLERMLEIEPRFDEIIIYQEGNIYEVYGQSVPYLCRNFDLKPEDEFLYARKVIEAVRIPGERVLAIKAQLEKDKFRVVIYNNTTKEEVDSDLAELEREAAAFMKMVKDEGLGAPYQPASDACVVLDTQVPDSMAFETQEAVALIEREVGGDIDNFVRDRLGYRTKLEMCKALSAEQIDAVAMAIYNIEARGQGMVIGDQTGIGKGRVAASIIRYGCQQGLTPIFLTEKANLFSDIYRDLAAIGSANLRPFIVNSREPKSDVKDEDGNVIYQALPPSEQSEVFSSGKIPVQFDFVCATYTQFNSAEKKPLKPNFLKTIAEDNIFIMDEAHNSSGSSQTGMFLQDVVRLTRGVAFLSATFAKRPDNMPIYALRTAISDSNLSSESLIYSITKGGVALQEVLSAQLVQEGQMLRRERSYEGVEVNYITLDDKAAEHRAISDNITQVMRDIIAFQKEYINAEVSALDEEAAKDGEEVAIREGTSEAGVDNEPYFSKIFQVINQMLFSLKAEAVAEQAIMRLKEGKKPVIAFSSTMGSFVEELVTQSEMTSGDDTVIETDFSQVLRKGLEGVLRYTVKLPDGTPSHHSFEVKELSLLAQIEYKRIETLIDTVSTGITISPIDVIIKHIRQAGFTVAEVTGRKYELHLNEDNSKGIVHTRRRLNTNDAFRLFNNNEADVLLINQAGSTGASAHAIPTAKVPATAVKQRVMIVLQAELDINTEVQKRGRINRTGQISKPIYDYVTSAVPAELRMMMILQRKLKSLDANTTSNQRQSNKILSVPDFLNKYGDKLVAEYLAERPDINDLLDHPVAIKGTDKRNENDSLVDAAVKVSGRVAVLSTQMQQEFYDEMSLKYDEYIEYLKQTGEYDLEVEAMNLEAETVATSIIKMGKGAQSVFGKDSILEKVNVNVLRKPFTATELNNLLTDSLGGRTALEIQQELINEFQKYGSVILEEEQKEVNEQIDKLLKNVQQEKKIKKLSEDMEAWRKAISEREAELEDIRRKKLAQATKKASDRKLYLNRILPFFYIGQVLNYPVRYIGEVDLVPSVFVGYLIDWKKKNPFAPSNIKLRFAISNSNKYIVIPASNAEAITSIIGASDKDDPIDRFALLDNWEQWINNSYVDRQIRYIITGNLLQAFADHPGKLISYTTLDGQVKKGILMSEYWNPYEQLKDKVSVPIIKALPLIRSLTNGNSINTNTGIGIFRVSSSSFKLIVSASRSSSGDVFLNEEILKLVEGNNFEKRADKMVAFVNLDNLDELIRVIQKVNNCAVDIANGQLQYVKQDEIYADRKIIKMPEPEPEPLTPEEEEELELLELEAEAATVIIALELELYGKAA
ncbi:DNA (cytosine-5-)-methyltransferase [Taibaiella soli]|uniref:Cytosine-specific methyltransferase n=1 Tax=Taibaiella soli TaxID=1649169 RepID=A0A2W2A8H6_9BACT|nr:DNA (cytosine-5-)-methyltransferase [Taibaiella soli]PZF71571.1 hypothetical protein DN068_15975 [Taibaiella soli]